MKLNKPYLIEWTDSAITPTLWEYRADLCGKKVNPRRWHLDHIVPLSQDGEHSYRNVAVSCPTCNLRKGRKIRGQFRLF